MRSNNSMVSINENADGSGTVEKTGVIVGAETSIDGPPACGVCVVSVPKVEMVNVGELMSMMRSAFAGPSVGISNQSCPEEQAKIHPVHSQCRRSP